MLEDAKGVNCQASNFSRAFSATPQASALGLMDDKTKSTSPYGSLIQNFNRWLLSTFSAEANIEEAQVDLRSSDLSGISLEVPTTVEQVVGIETITTNTCANCGFVTTRPATITTVDLTYPNKVSHTGRRLRSGLTALGITHPFIRRTFDLVDREGTINESGLL